MTDAAERPAVGVVLDDAPPSTLVERDLACVTCAYPLRGHERAGVCPECGTGIARSLRGDALRLADPRYLRRLRLGTRLAMMPFLVVVAGILLNIVGMALGVFMTNEAGELVLNALWILIPVGVIPPTLAWPIGWFLITTSEPAIERPVWLRRFMVRAGSAVCSATFLALFLYVEPGTVGEPVAVGFGVLFFIGCALFYYPSLLALFAIVARAPGYHYIGAGPTLILVVGPVFGVIVAADQEGYWLNPPRPVVSAAFVGSFVWAVVYVALIDRARRAVAAEYAHSDRTGA